MCGGPEPSDTSSYAEVNSSIVNEVEGCDLGNGDSVLHLLELAASNDLDGFQKTVKEPSAEVNGVGSWYGRRNGTTMMMWEHRTPAMIASLFGSVEVLKYILSNFDFQEVTDKKCGSDCSSALHCAAAGGSTRAIETVILLLDFGADLNSTDAHGQKPVDVIAPFPKRQHVKEALKDLLEAKGSLQHKSREFLVEHGVPLCLEDEKNAFMVDNGKVDTISGVSAPISLFTSSEGSPFSSPSPSSSPTLLDMVSRQEGNLDREKAREYFVDPSIPDIKYSLYMTDEFRMFSFKVRPCSRAYSHDWTECPFVHPGENARRRDPRRYHYSCVPCPDFRKGACRRGDACEYAHGVFESWLHPAQYRTRLCKDGIDCTRRVCFFAHTNDELRPLYVSSGSAIPCPRTTSPMDILNVSPPLRPGSPLSAYMLNAFSSSSAQGNHTTPPMSPSSSPANSLVGVVWSPSNVPLLHLPGVNLQASRLRSALNARDISLEDYGWASEFDGPNETAPLSSHVLSTQARLNAAVAATSSSRYRNLGLTISPTGLEELSPSDLLSSPRSLTQGNSLISHLEGQMQSHKLSPLSAHMQGKLGSPSFSSLPDQYVQLQQAVALDPQMLGSPRRHSCNKIPAYSLGSLGHMQTPGGLAVDMQNGPLGQVTPGGLDIDVQTCNGTSLPPSVVATRAAFGQRDKRSLSSREMATGYWASDWGSLTGKTGWGSPTGKPEWGVPGEGLLKFQKSASFVSRGKDEPDVMLVPAVVKEKPAIDCDNGVNQISTDESISYSSKPVEHLALGSWMENIQLDEIIA